MASSSVFSVFSVVNLLLPGSTGGLNLRRHCFAWFSQAACHSDEVVRDAPPDDLKTAESWLECGLPVIIRRPCVSEDGSNIFVGLAPPEAGKRRMAFCFPASCLRALTDPPLWRDCVPLASQETVATVDPIQTAAADSGLLLQTFGSYAWQFHTSFSYVTQHSDVDLIVPVNRKQDWIRFRKLMAGISREWPRIDLEIVLTGDASFSWWEFINSGTRLLFKGNRDVWIGQKSAVETLLD
jgi:malonate decarboxylase holo-[acyl-carrier-protein] synthase